MESYELPLQQMLFFGNFGLTSLCDFKDPPPLRQKMVLPSVDTLSPVSY